MDAFTATAEFYDRINGEQYAPYADFLEGCFASFSKIQVKEVLDLGCGTGGITGLLAQRGYDMVGADSSPDMLSIARKNTASSQSILYLCQDMRNLELYGTVQAAYSSFDCVNYLESIAELDGVFSLLRNYIETGGLLVFDVNTRYRYEEVFSNNCFVYEFGKDMLIWQNRYSPSKKTCGFYLSLFKEENGVYLRENEEQRQRCFSVRAIKALLRKNRFFVTGVYGSTAFLPLEKTSEKAYFIAVAE